MNHEHRNDGVINLSCAVPQTAIIEITTDRLLQFRLTWNSIKRCIAPDPKKSFFAERSFAAAG
jgi:hypothetical protein